MGNYNCGTYVLLITSPISGLLNYLFVYRAGWGLFSAPFATGIGYWLSFLGLILYARFVSGRECWGGWSRRCLQNTGTFARLAFLGVLHVGSEW
jgi:MATE family multidrug resistance protein